MIKHQCPFRVDKDIPAGPGPWRCVKPVRHDGYHHLEREMPHVAANASGQEVN
jgi:hypothetical protein